ncbi:hypothetical protein CFR78_10835 [Komagataeibacter rhaeticus]|uniref:hypothetical protein n=1 Tax=Komagataeibacter rhaeticus TaxID=215221 RepID=UPI0004D8C0F6|nr:hypothetical protein [Komagataeibacter rhaeticus]KDU96449.1 hypothetical protein GLUCORHAEAF1_01625 [Komagataeibacter rhaeticus AF1]PYD53248.1 hypothetical protein CFR78_10835 [Komagataeibacter rhaeticus]GBQ12656.1 hypothetical protein AA16663_1245 [Komagataeibacter rhaeticus DSM 16663]
MTDTATATYQNYILYRTKALMFQPSYNYLSGDTPVIPAATTASPVGEVVGTQSLTGLTGITAPDGFAFALDADGKYPVGSIYTPPATSSATS